MASLLRKLRPSSVAAVPPVEVVEVEDSNSSYEYSFAVVYNGPPLSYSIPEVPAFTIDQVPVAAIAASHDLNNFSVPVIQPLGKTHHKNKQKKLPNGSIVVPSNLDSHDDAVESSNSAGDLLHNNSATTTINLRVPAVDDDKKEEEEEGFDTTESGSSSGSGSSEICSLNEDECKSETVSPKHAKRPSAVKFRDPESNYTVGSTLSDEEFIEFDEVVVSAPVRPPHAVRPGKKGCCYKCRRGNHLMEREVCIVCSAKYCRSCVIRAMGSMPEGRKCVTCIGQRIDESKRGKLGKCSRMLKKLLSEPAVAKIMDDEKFCKANQLPPELVIVNSQRLNQEQLMLLLRCPNPPKDLKPGSYWYDKGCGFWGKKGCGPCQIISPRLDVGGSLQRNASNGNTNVTINDREITKKERWILKLAGVPCEGTPNLWMNADGICQEVGQRNEMGRIWEKRKAKLACTVLSLPLPSKSVTASDKDDVNRANNDCLQQKMLHKFLLVGSVNSGACTIFKQAKILYNVPFTENELQNIKLVIQSNLFTYLGILLEGREQFEEDSLLENRKRWPLDESTSSGITGETTIYSIGRRLKSFADLILQYMESGDLDAVFPAAIREYGPLVEDLWKDEAIQATYSRRNELKMLPRSANYFLDRAVEISKMYYQPPDMDILYAEGISLSNSLTSMEFSFPKTSGEESLFPEYQHDSSLRYQLVRVHPTSLGENCKWLEMFEDTDIVLFSIALTDYDEYTVDSKGVATNKMLAAKSLFENIITHTAFNKKKFLLILTKFDLLEEKIEQVPLTRCEWFCDFNPVISHNQNKGNNNGNSTSLVHRAFQYIATKFKRLFHSLTGHKLFVSLVTGLEADTIDEALRYAREVVEWQKWESSLVTEKSEITSTSIEASSS